MFLTKERIGAVFFLALFSAYGFYVGDIRLFPGDELEPMTARTLPYFFTALGLFLCVILLINGKGKSEDLNLGDVFEWIPVVLLLLLTLLYGFALDWLGFIISTIVFLIGGFRILGEKRLKILLLVSVPFVLIFWYGLTQLLEIYLSPGRLFAIWS